MSRHPVSRACGRRVVLAALLAAALVPGCRRSEAPAAAPKAAPEPAAAAPAEAPPPAVAVAPFTGPDGAPGWLGLAVADHLTTRLLVQSKIDAATKQARYPFAVFTWRQTLAAARAEGIAPADAVKRAGELRAQLGANVLLAGTWVRAGDDLALRWQLLGAKASEPRETKCTLATATQASYDIAKAVLAELAPGFDARVGGAGFPALPAEALQSYGEAVELLAAQSLDPRARLVLSRDEVRKAEALLQKVNEAVPAFARAWTERGIAAAMLGNQAIAEAALVQAAIQKDDPEPSTALGIFYMYDRAGNGPEALKALEGAVAAYPGSLQALGYLGDAYLREKRWQDALDTFTTYAQRVPGNPWAKLRRGAALASLDQHAAALQETQAVLARHPQSVAVLLAMSSRQIDASRYDEARATIARGLALRPDDPALTTRLAYIEIAQNRPEAALALADKAAAAIGDGRGEPLAGYANVDRAHALALLGRTDEAFAALRRAAELGIGADELAPLVRDPKLQGFVADPRFAQASAPAK